MTQATQRDLFGPIEAPPAPRTGLFAEIVFDRPLDHAYSYAVPDELRAQMAVGKRVQAPFGRGDKPTVGYCVGLSETAPDRAVKEVLRVLDDEALLTESLMRLTRWMADYYLCGWGQVLNAVIPAGARERAGTRSTAYLEAVPEAELPQPPPKLSAKQSAALDHLRSAGRALEARQLARLAKCGPAPLESLVEKGYARRVVRRVDRFADSSEDAAEA
ncbi:MAG TPA: primosomal protein N', partial [Gemmataceae bacterium]|nr:primosomal protein N' [Gemmataceae bacterium]